jgi:hypothetical protein
LTLTPRPAAPATAQELVDQARRLDLHPVQVGTRRWRAGCPCCGAAGRPLRIGAGDVLLGLVLVCGSGCTRADVLARLAPPQQLEGWAQS